MEIFQTLFISNFKESFQFHVKDCGVSHIPPSASETNHRVGFVFFELRPTLEVFVLVSFEISCSVNDRSGLKCLGESR